MILGWQLKRVMLVYMEILVQKSEYHLNKRTRWTVKKRKQTTITLVEFLQEKETFKIGRFKSIKPQCQSAFQFFPYLIYLEVFKENLKIGLTQLKLASLLLLINIVKEDVPCQNKIGPCQQNQSMFLCNTVQDMEEMAEHLEFIIATSHTGMLPVYL